MTAVWASCEQDLVSDSGVAPHVCDSRVVPDRGEVLHSVQPTGGNCGRLP
jgi:hypothetical protein